MTDPRIPDPRHTDPTYPGSPTGSPYNDPSADPRLSERPPYSGGGRSGLIAAAVIAVLLVIALIAFSSGPTTDPGTTAVIPEQNEEMAPAPEAAPEQPAAPLENAPAPAEQ